jgi:type IV secretory pathway TrbF-like protein
MAAAWAQPLQQLRAFRDREQHLCAVLFDSFLSGMLFKAVQPEVEPFVISKNKVRSSSAVPPPSSSIT